MQGQGTWRRHAAQVVGALIIATCLTGQQPAVAEIQVCLLVSQPPSQQRPCQRWAVLICLSPLQTVTAGEATGLAKPLPKQGVKKGKVWAIFIGGAVSIFATTVLLENNERLFPAIKKANVASQMARQRMQVRLRSAVCCTAASELQHSQATLPRPATDPGRCATVIRQLHFVHCLAVDICLLTCSRLP